MVEDRFSRQVLAFGEVGQRSLALSHVGVVGVGGLGSQIIQALAYLGVGRFTLIDDDRVEPSNLNRLIGAKPNDIGRSKAEILTKTVAAINPDALCEPIVQNLRSRTALAALQNASVVFGCVDNDGARLILLELCCAYRKLYIDSATEIVPPQAGAPLDFGGRVVVSVPGDFCLMCASELDTEAAKVDLESAPVRSARAAHGYGIGQAAVAPSVVSLNGVIANIAVTEFMAKVTGLRSPITKSTYKGMRGIVQVSLDKRRDGCINCEYLVGRGDRAEIMRYALD
jgi:molybdopterin/thiamine biosynthesis adenylyltransferase